MIPIMFPGEMALFSRSYRAGRKPVDRCELVDDVYKYLSIARRRLGGEPTIVIVHPSDADQELPIGLEKFVGKIRDDDFGLAVSRDS